MQQRTRRRGFILGLLSLGVLIGAALTGGPAQAQTTSVGPYYATPSWDQTLPSTTRFIILSNFASAAVLDRETGLVWERAPQTVTTWSTARLICNSMTTGNRKGWRLPSVHELASLVDPTQANPALPLGHPFTNVQSSRYWSATTDAELPTEAFVVSFANGGASQDSKTSISFDTGQGVQTLPPPTLRVWCMRGGMNADAY